MFTKIFHLGVSLFSETATCGYGDVLDLDLVLERRDLLPFLLSAMAGVEFA